MAKEYFDLLVIIPLEEELIEFTSVFQTQKDYSTKTDFRYGFRLGDSLVTGLVVQQDEPGKSGASRAAQMSLENFDVGLVVCLGIAGAMSNDLQLTDVCYSGEIIDVLENNKASNKPDGTIELEFSPTHFSTPKDITAALNFFRTRPDLRPHYLHWQEQQCALARRTLGVPVIGRNGKEEELEAPKSKNGAIVCGPVSKSPALNKKLLGIDRKILAIETESGGIFEQSAVKIIPALTIRGISDYADQGKTELEESTGGRVRKLAALNAATFLGAQFNNRYFLDILTQRRLLIENISSTSTAVAAPLEMDIATVVASLGKEIDSKLRELSPEFRLQPKGYRLPVPRIRSVEVNQSLGGPSNADPIEVRDALEGRNTLLIIIPRTYPDNSLPWILADDLLTADVGNRQIIPIVLSGDDIKPPKGTLALAARAGSVNVAHLTEVQPVYIIDGVPFNSKTRISYLIEQVKENPDAKFVFVARGDMNLIKESEFVGKLSADVFNITQISFREIAFFIQKNFAMSGSEAEVIALRLKNTFKQFALSAHPTYFAGIPRETLSALLQANRRSELIQLAVDGFLTFVVASDRADVTLSRTTRSRFLRKLALELNAEKVTFTQDQLIRFTKDFSTKYDFDIDPLAFIHSFVEKGILHFEGDHVRFTLPFIESYLLAVELKENPDIAGRYFQISGSDFDFPTFDLYAEMGASSEFVAAVFSSLDEKVEYLQAARNAPHILLTDQVRPSLLAKPERVRALQNRINKAMEDVQNNNDDKDRKQRILDVADRIRETAVEKSEKKKAGSEESDQRADLLSSCLQAWSIGVLLLGAGAEHLEAVTKQRLSKILIRIAAMAVDEWTQMNVQVDFDDIKKELTTKETIEKFFGEEVLESKYEENCRTITGLVDILEYSFLGEPFRRIINHLCEHARLRVLAPSVEKAEVEGLVDKIIYGAWLADIDGRRGKQALVDAIKELPPAPFLRIILATHFLTRVYWSHWKEADRLMLLDSAAELLKPVHISVDKPKLKREVEGASKKVEFEEE